MNQTIRPIAKRIGWLLMFAYFASYVTRTNFAVMLVKICIDMNQPKTAMAIVVTGLTITYGAGQIISGFMGDRIKAQTMITLGLIIACLSNVAMTLCYSIPLMTAVWCVNGFAHAMLWPPIVRLMSEYLTDTEYGYATVRVTWGSSFATILLYLGCPMLLYVMNWRVVMLICALVATLLLAAWIVFNPRLLVEKINGVKAKTDGASAKAETVPVPRFVYLPLVLIMLGITMQGMLRDGVTNWMPFYMQETFHITAENAIITTVILAVFSVVSSAFFTFVYQKFFKNEVCFSSLIFAMSLLSAAAMFVADHLGAGTALPMILMGIIVACMHGVNIMLIAIVPKRFVKSGKVSTYSGILNAFTYIGAAISTYGFALLAESFGWGVTILSWGAIAAVGCALCAVATPMWTRFRREYFGKE